ncbi:unnamed protein product [Gordionus sp. m RMFG-2023]
MLQINSLFLWMLVLTFVFSSILQVRPEEGLEVQSNDHRETTISNLGTVRCFHVTRIRTTTIGRFLKHIGRR